jgi:putative ABC transport system permease protein
MSDFKWRRYARFLGPDLRADIDDEMEFHIQMIAAKHVAAGLSPDAARRKAVSEFGDLERARETCMRIDEQDARATRRAEFISNLALDLKHGLRRLLKNPTFSIVTVLTLALGIGPNVAIFSIINSVLLTPLPFAAPQELMYVQETFTVQGGTGSGSVSWENYLDWRQRSRSFSEMGLTSFTSSANLGNTDRPERLSVARITASTWPTLGVRPFMGRNFTAEEEMPGGPEVVILSETLWRSHYNGDPGIIGKQVTLDGTAREVIGVMPDRIVFPNVSTVVHAWLPIQFRPVPAGTRGNHQFRVVARLKPGATRESATQDLKAVAAQLEQEYPAEQEGRSIIITPLTDFSVGFVRTQLGILFGAAGLVLLIACANAASLLLARAAGRAREVAVLAALGASRARVAQQFLTESVLLSVLGAVFGFVLGVAAVKGIVASAGTQLPRSREIEYDAVVIGFVVSTIFLTTLLFGLVPALRATKTNLSNGLRDAARGTSGRAGGAFRSGLVVAQFALSLVLLAGAGLLIRTFAALMGTDTGMPTDRLLTMRIPVPVGSTKYPGGNATISRFHVPLLERVSALPGVEGAGMISRIPLHEYGTNGNFTIIGRPPVSQSQRPFAEMRVVSPGYFKAVNAGVLSGRDFSAVDDSASPTVVVVSDALAKKYFGDRSPIGEQLQFGSAGPANPPATIVGVVRGVRQARLDLEPLPELYWTTGQAFWALRDMALIVRTSGDPSQLAVPVQNVVRQLDPEQPVYLVRTMSRVLSDSISDRRLYMRLLGAFSAIALVLAMAGIYGVISYSVTQRTREFGIRLALGSQGNRLQRMVVWDGARLAVIGLVIGIPAAIAATRLLRGIVYGVSPFDPVTFGAVAVILAGVALAASYVPARRASRVDPIIAMQSE